MSVWVEPKSTSSRPILIRGNRERESGRHLELVVGVLLVVEDGVERR